MGSIRVMGWGVCLSAGICRQLTGSCRRVSSLPHYLAKRYHNKTPDILTERNTYLNHDEDYFLKGKYGVI